MYITQMRDKKKKKTEKSNFQNENVWVKERKPYVV